MKTCTLKLTSPIGSTDDMRVFGEDGSELPFVAGLTLTVDAGKQVVAHLRHWDMEEPADPVNPFVVGRLRSDQFIEEERLVTSIC